MVNEQLLGYVRQQLSLGIKREVITNNLKPQGWTDADLNEAFSAIASSISPTQTPASSPVSGAAQNVVQMHPMQNNFSDATHKKGKGKKIFLAILIIILLAGGGFGAYAYYTGVFVKLPDLLSESFENAKEVKSGKYDITLNVDFSDLKDVVNSLKSIPSLNIDASRINLNVKGSSDVSDTKNIKNSSVISINMGSFSLEAELRLINDTIYAQLIKAPDLPSSPVPSYMFEDKWFSFAYVNSVLANTFTGSPSTTFDSMFTVDQKDHLYQMFRDAHIIKTVARLNPETVGGETSYHFSFDLDRDGIIIYFKSLGEYINTIDKNNPSISIDDSAQISKVLDTIKDFKGEIWIGRSD